MKQNWVEKTLQRECDNWIFDLICKGPLQKNYEKCKVFPTGSVIAYLPTLPLKISDWSPVFVKSN